MRSWLSIGTLISFLSAGCAVVTPVNPSSHIIFDIPGGRTYSLAAPPADLLDNTAYTTSHIVLRRIPAGAFTMGSPHGESARPGLDETPHQVTIAKEFLIGVFEVTQEQWTLVMGVNPSYFKDSESGLPVESVTWLDCQEFIERLNSRSDSLLFAFPTEAEWEYACRGGADGPISGTGRLDEMGWHSGNSDGRPHPVGMKAPNSWGLYDMHGNVYEWCVDWYGKYPESGVADPSGPNEGDHRIERGGSWATDPKFCRSADRNMHIPEDSSHHLGLRLAARLRK